MFQVIEMLLALFLMVIAWEEACKWQASINKIKAIKAGISLQEALQVVKAQGAAKERNAQKFFHGGKVSC